MTAVWVPALTSKPWQTAPESQTIASGWRHATPQAGVAAVGKADDAAPGNRSSRLTYDFARIPVAGKRSLDGFSDGVNLHGTTHSTTLSRDGDVETVTETADRDTSMPMTPRAANHCALSSATFTSIPSGTLAATLSGGRLQAPFVMRATFDTPIPCTCANGEYRQYVRGTFTAGGATVTHMLGPGRPMSATVFQEDGDVGAGTVYGHRAIPGTKSRFRPDQATGCQFEGEDEPGISAPSGTAVTMNLDFRGDLIDTSDANRVVTTASWSVAGSGTMP